MEQPDITFTEARNAALANAFNGLDAILSNGFEFPSWGVSRVDSTGFFVNLARTEYHCGDRETTEESIFVSWDELTNLPPEELIKLTEQRWQEGLRDRAIEALKKKEKEEAEARKRAAEAAEKAHKDKVKTERARLRELMEKYPDEVKKAVIT